mgnify:CR=1 FL=1
MTEKILVFGAKEGYNRTIMNEEHLKFIISQKITYYRKANGHTQAELAEILNYSDKSVSKWERAEGMPDIGVLVQIAELYGTTVNDLISDAPPQVKPDERIKNRLVTLLSVGLVWLVATVVFCAIGLLNGELDGAWLTFIYAVAVSFIVLVVFATLWWSKLIQFLSVSGLIWSLALCLHLSVSNHNIVLIYIVAGVLQILAAGWFRLRSWRKKS